MTIPIDNNESILKCVLCIFLLLGSLIPLTTVYADQSDASEEVDRSFMITQESAGPSKRFEAFDATTFTVFDLDGDGIKEIIAHNDNNNIYVFSGDDGTLIAELETRHPDPWGARELAGVSVGDVNGNGIMDLVATNSAGWTTAFEARAAEDPEDRLVFEKLWETWMDPRDQDPDYLENHPWAEFDGHPGLDGAPYLADTSGDGNDEIFLQLDDMPGFYKMNGDGEVVGWRSWSEGNSNPVATDFTGDGEIEVMYPSDGGRIMMFNAEHFYSICSIDLREYGPDPASISVAPTAADITGDGAKEMIFGVRHAIENESDPEWHLKMNAHYFAVNAQCEVLWQQSWEWGNPHIYMHPVPVDVTGNGEKDIIFQDWNTIGHKPGNWEETGKANLFAVEGKTGRLIWQVETESYWSNKNIAVGDATGDGSQEILVVEARGGQDGLMAYALDGKRKGFIPGPSGWDVSRGPALTDLDGDGRLDIILPVHRKADGCTRDLDVGCREGAFQVYSTPGTQEPVWSNVMYYNHLYDHAGAAPVAPAPEISVWEAESQSGVYALETSGDSVARSMHIRVPGSDAWQRLESEGNDRFVSNLPFQPAPGDEVQTRILLEDGRVAYKSYEAEGAASMLEVQVQGSDGRPIEGATVKISDGNKTVWSGKATSDGLVRVSAQPGAYSIEASAPGHWSGSGDAQVEGDGVTRTTIELRSHWGWVTIVGIAVGLVVLAGAVAGTLVVKKRRP